MVHNLLLNVTFKGLLCHFKSKIYLSQVGPPPYYLLCMPVAIQVKTRHQPSRARTRQGTYGLIASLKFNTKNHRLRKAAKH